MSPALNTVGLQKTGGPKPGVWKSGEQEQKGASHGENLQRSQLELPEPGKAQSERQKVRVLRPVSATFLPR